MLRKFGTWEKTDCDECGCEYQVTRTEPREMEKCICGDCEIYTKAYEEGYRHGRESVKPRYRILTA
jgi:hypothetical protein